MTRGSFASLTTHLTLLGLVVAAACSGPSTEPVDGSDVDRSGDASMESVRFSDVADEVGLDFRHSAFRWDAAPDPEAMMGGGLCWIDYDRDGWLDLYLVDTWTQFEWAKWRTEGAIPTSRLYRNESGRFTDVSDSVGAAVENRANGCVAADFDLDGWTDIYITTTRENVLLWNDGGDGFTVEDVENSPSGASTYGWHGGASVGDVDGNGWPDLFVAGYANVNAPRPTDYGFPRIYQAVADVLLLNQGPADGARVRFTDVAAEVGVEPAGADWGLGALLSDLDLDGDLDLYVANDTTPNQLYEHVADGDGWRFVERGVEAGVGDTGAGMGVAADDADGDVLPDLVATNQIEERNMLARNLTDPSGNLAFEVVNAAAGVADFGLGSTGWGTSWTDVDLDGDVDLLAANGAIPVTGEAVDLQHVQLLENRLGDGGGLRDAGDATGLADLGPYLGRGLAMGDYDNDGDLDVAVGTIGGQVALLRNSGAGGNWLVVDLGAPHPGVVVTARLGDGRELRRELVVGGSYLSSHDPRAHFGLGSATVVEELVIGFPDGAEIRLDDVSAGQILHLDADDRA
jgi:hypothetical protein